MKLPERGKELSLDEVKELCLYLGLVDLLEKIERDPPIIPFKSDGCTLWPDKWKSKDGKIVDLYEECLKHDLCYWAGYPDEYMARFLADAGLMIDVGIKTKRTSLAIVMFLGVRAGGVNFFSKRKIVSKLLYSKTNFVWGFGRR